MILLLPYKDIYAIAVPLYATAYELEESNLLYYTSISDMPNDIELPAGKWQILGEVTKDAISFDVSGLVSPCKPKSKGYCEDFCQGSCEENFDCEEEFYYLLTDSELYFENPIPDRDMIEWQSYEDKLIQKALIIQKIIN